MTDLRVAVQWVAVYRHEELNQEVTLRSERKPTRTRRFRVRGHGKPIFEAVSIQRVGGKMSPKPKTKKSTRTRKPKQAEVEQVEVEEEDLDLEDVDLDDDDLEDLEDSEEPDAEDDEDTEDEDDEEEAPAPRKRSRKGKAASSTKTDRKAQRAKGKRQPPPQRELPKGKVGPDAIAKAAGVDARAVRQYLRSEGVDKDAELGRYAFTQKQAQQIAKKVKARSK